jgi:phosphoadenylyl-sulfate reductase (thioredoxin)
LGQGLRREDLLEIGETDVESINRSLAGARPEAVLEWAAQTFRPRIAFVTAFGPEGCVLLDLIGSLRLPIEVWTLDTGLLFPETRALWRSLEERYHLSVRALRPAQTLEAQEAEWGAALWKRDPDRCCALRKVEPLRRALADVDAWISSIRREQTKERSRARLVEPDLQSGVLKVNPLVEWTHEDVWKHLRAANVPVNALHARGYPSIGCEPCTSPVGEGEDPRAGRWRGRVKTECGLHKAIPLTLVPKEGAP